LALWRKAGDPHAAITIDHLLHMTSGLAWTEDAHDPRSDVLLMAYHSRDTADYAAHKPMAYPAGGHFTYNSGAANILARVLLTALHDNRDEYLALPREALFDPAGMSSAVLAPDASGTLFGSTQAFATARDWARFGELYLHDGQRNGVQVLPHGWVEYCATPEPATQTAGYGALIWENRGKPGHSQDRPRPSLPEDALLMTGQFGQTIAVIPSYNAVIVRLGETHGRTIESDRERLIVGVLASLQQGR
jgi:CubicO group peptidase (beta-lactamase class C family)